MWSPFAGAGCLKHTNAPYCLSRGASLILADHARPLCHPWPVAIQQRAVRRLLSVATDRSHTRQVKSAQIPQKLTHSEFGLRVPADIAVSGFDNAGYAPSPAYDLTTYEQPIDEMVEATVEMILGRRDRKTVQLRGRLVPRSSA